MDVQSLQFDGTKIKQFMPEGMSIAELARQTGVTRQAMHDITTGRRNPSANLLVKILTVLEIKINQVSV